MEPPLLLKITYVQPDGTCRQVQARAGVSLMEAAVRANVEGIEAKCRGNCACVTCHVYIDPRWSAVMSAPTTKKAAGRSHRLAPGLRGVSSAGSLLMSHHLLWPTSL